MSFNESQSCSAENENLKHLLSDAKNETIKCQQADIVSDNEVNNLQEQIQKLLELNKKLTNESAIYQMESHDLRTEAVDLQMQNEDLLELNKKITNESFFHQNKAEQSNRKIEELLMLNQKLTNESAFYHTELVQINIKLENETDILLKKANDLSIEAADLRIQNQDLLEFNEKITNDSFFYQNKAEELLKLNKKLVTDNNFLQEKINNFDIEKEKLINSCNGTNGKSDFDTLGATGNVFVSSITAVENAREIDICLGMSTVIGYFTSRSCCDVNEIYLYDIESSSEIIFHENSVSVEEHICFINTTEVKPISFKDTNFDDPQNCSIVVYDESQEKFKNYSHTFEIQRCFDAPCSFQVDLTEIQNTTILNGTSVFCHESGHFGVIIKS